MKNITKLDIELAIRDIREAYFYDDEIKDRLMNYLEANIDDVVEALLGEE